MTYAIPAQTVPAVPPWVIAFVAALLVASLEIAGVWTAGPMRVHLHNPLGLSVLAFVGDAGGWPAAAPRGKRLLAFQLFIGAKAATAVLAVFCAAIACSTPSARRRSAMLAAQLACAIVLDSLPFHLIVAVQLGMLLRLRVALVWLSVHYALGVGVDLLLVLEAGQRQAPPLWSLLAYVSAERTVIVAGFILARLVLRERRTRQALATAHAQVLATQSLLAETVRASERMRIARDLHDMVGHHLTALNLHLDLAMRQAGAAAPPSLPTAREVGRDLLAQVRSAVTTTRQDRAIDLEEALRVLCAGLPSVRVELRIEAGAARQPAPVAHTLFCCIQEAVTNTLRHAGARRLTIALASQDGVTVARVADDGCGKACATEGNGLRGMRERLAGLGGELRYAAGHGGGFALEMRLPQAASAA